MAIYKIFPTQDSTLYSLTPDANFGMDAILEASNIIGVDGTPDVARFLVQFDTDEIVDIRFNGRPKNFEDFMKHFLSPDVEKVFGQWLDLNFREKGITINDILSDIEDGLYRGDIKP